MITVEPLLNPKEKPAKKMNIKVVLLVLLLSLVGVVAAICHFGSPSVHKEKPHLLYSSFDSSSAHKNLINNLQKNKLILVVGSKSDGVVNFFQHYANKMVKEGKTVYFQILSANSSGLIDLTKDVNQKIKSAIGIESSNGSWILISQSDELFPMEKITQIQTLAPHDKIIVVSTKKQKLKGFKSLTYPKLEDKILQKAALKNLAIKKNTFEILQEHHESHEELFESLELPAFTPETFLKEDFVSLEGLDSEDEKVLKDLCQKGQAKSKKSVKEPQRLEKYGVIHVKNTFHWENTGKILNYELATGVNCKNKAASEELLKTYQENQQKEEVEKKKKEEAEQKKKEEAERKMKEEAEKKGREEHKKKEQQAAKKEKVKAKQSPKSKGKKKAKKV